MKGSGQPPEAQEIHKILSLMKKHTNFSDQDLEKTAEDIIIPRINEWSFDLAKAKLRNLCILRYICNPMGDTLY
jgi:hypothetical protein